MPHDSKGRKIEQGDYIKGKAWYNGQKSTVYCVSGVCEGQDSCNVNAVAFHPGIPMQTLQAKECDLVLKADGSEPAAQ